MSRSTFLALAIAAALGTAPAHADQLLGQGRILESGPNSGDILFGALKLGKRQGGKTALTPDTIQIQGPGSTGPIDGMTVGGAAIGAAPSASAPPDSMARRIFDASIPAIANLSSSQNTFGCTTVANGSGQVVCPSNHDFAKGHGVLVAGVGPAFGNYSAISGVGTTEANKTGKLELKTGGVIGPAGTTTRCYVWVPLDGRQGYGAPSPQWCVANAPETPSPDSYVKLTWTNGSSPPPAYAIYQGPSGGPYTLLDFADNAGAGLPQQDFDYGRPAPKPEFWLPSTISATLTPQREAVHSLISSVSGGTIDIGYGLSLPAGTPVTLRHDNALPIRFGLANAPAGSCVRIPTGTYSVSATNFSGSTITWEGGGKCLVGTDRAGTVVSLTNAALGAPVFAVSGVRPLWGRLTLTADGYSSGNNIALVSITDAISPVLEDFSMPSVAKNAIGNTRSFDTVIRRFDATGVRDFANKGTFLHSTENYRTRISDFVVDGFGFDMADNGCSIQGGTLRNFNAAGIGTEIGEFGRACVMQDLDMTAALDTHLDINSTVTECIESWQPDDQIINVRCNYAVGSAFSIGGKRSIVTGNYAKSTLNTGVAAYALRFDDPNSNAEGAVVFGNTVGSGYTHGLSAVTKPGVNVKCNGCMIGSNNFAAASVAPINFASLTGAEIFTTATRVTFAQLPTYHAAATAGRRLFCTDCRKPPEGANAGTGIEVVDDGTAWITGAGAAAAK